MSIDNGYQYGLMVQALQQIFGSWSGLAHLLFGCLLTLSLMIFLSDSRNREITFAILCAFGWGFLGLFIGDALFGKRGK